MGKSYFKSEQLSRERICHIKSSYPHHVMTFCLFLMFLAPIIFLSHHNWEVLWGLGPLTEFKHSSQAYRAGTLPFQSLAQDINSHFVSFVLELIDTHNTNMYTIKLAIFLLLICFVWFVCLTSLETWGSELIPYTHISDLLTLEY